MGTHTSENWGRDHLFATPAQVTGAGEREIVGQIVENTNTRQKDMATFIPAGAQSPALSSIKAGMYPCEIVGAVAKISKDGRFEQHSLRVRVFDEKNDDWEDFWELLTFSSKAQWKLEEVMTSLGMGFTIGQLMEIEAGDWMGRTGKLLLKEDKEPGQNRLRIGRWIAREDTTVGSVVSRPSTNREDAVDDDLPF